MKRALKRDCGTRWLTAPEFLERSRTDLLVVNPNVGSKTPKAFATRQFALKMLKGAHPENTTAMDETPEHLLQKMLNQCCPGYPQLVSCRYLTRDVMQECAMFCDLVFITGVWRYSRSLLPQDRGDYPCGLFDWPPSGLAWWDAMLAEGGSAASAEPASAGSASGIVPASASTDLAASSSASSSRVKPKASSG